MFMYNWLPQFIMAEIEYAKRCRERIKQQKAEIDKNEQDEAEIEKMIAELTKFE